MFTKSLQQLFCGVLLLSVIPASYSETFTSLAHLRQAVDAELVYSQHIRDYLIKEKDRLAELER